MAEGYTSIRVILDKVMRHPLMQDLNFETAVDYTIDFMRIMGCPNMFEEKTMVLTVDEFRAKLPDDFYRMLQVKSIKNNCMFRYTTNTMHMSDNKKCCGYDLTYKIQGGVIFTSIKRGDIEIAYEAIITDEDGYPLLPDNSSFTRALELFIKKQWFTMLFELGKISLQALQNAQQDYAWAAGDCHCEFNRLTLDKAESFYNAWRHLSNRNHEHSRAFKNLGTRTD